MPSEIKYGAQIMTVIKEVDRAYESSTAFQITVTEQAWPWQQSAWEQVSP